MSLPQEPGQGELPIRDLLLAHALDACIAAERRAPGSAAAIIARQPAWARADLERLTGLVGQIEATRVSASPSAESRAATRARLMLVARGSALGDGEPAVRPTLTALPNRLAKGRERRTWVWPTSAALLAAALGAAATLTASASALPGEPLYSLKQAHEALGVRLAADDQGRALALLGEADARLDEATRLLQQGRTDAALETTLRYGEVVERATATYVVAIDDSSAQSAGTTQKLEAELTAQEEQLQRMIRTAPELVRGDLREALVTTERGRALVADPRPVERALGKVVNDRPAAAAVVPTAATEELPTAMLPAEPTAAYSAEPDGSTVAQPAEPSPGPTLMPTPRPQDVVVVAQSTVVAQPEVARSQPAAPHRDSASNANGHTGTDTGNREDGNATNAVVRLPNAAPTANSRAQPPVEPARPSSADEDQHPGGVQHADDVVIAPPAEVAIRPSDSRGGAAPLVPEAPAGHDDRPAPPVVETRPAAPAVNAQPTGRPALRYTAQPVPAARQPTPTPTPTVRLTGADTESKGNEGRAARPTLTPTPVRPISPQPGDHQPGGDNSRGGGDDNHNSDNHNSDN